MPNSPLHNAAEKVIEALERLQSLPLPWEEKLDALREADDSGVMNELESWFWDEDEGEYLD